MEVTKRDLLIHWWKSNIGGAANEIEYSVFLEALDKNEEDLLDFIFMNRFATEFILAAVRNGKLESVLEETRKAVEANVNNLGEVYYQARRIFIGNLSVTKHYQDMQQEPRLSEFGSR